MNGIIEWDIKKVKKPQVEDIEQIPRGDMPGDKSLIGEKIIDRVDLVFPRLMKLIEPIIKNERVVISIFGGSGTGKTETASVLAYYLKQIGIGAYTLSGDNYVHRIPKHNDAERLRIYRHTGIQELIKVKEYTGRRSQLLKGMQCQGEDSDVRKLKEYPWLSIYQRAGEFGLKNYLGTNKEINFKEINEIIKAFKKGDTEIFLKRLGRDIEGAWYEAKDFNNIEVLIVEWTHGNNSNLRGIDIPIMLCGSPQDTLEHRKKRNRDKNVDSSFMQTVLSIEWDKLMKQAKTASLIVTPEGNDLEYQKLVVQG